MSYFPVPGGEKLGTGSWAGRRRLARMFQSAEKSSDPHPHIARVRGVVRLHGS